MGEAPLTRKQFLHLSLITGAGALVAGCQGASGRGDLSNETQEPAQGILLSGGDADAWAWQKPVHGQLSQPETCAAVSLLVNGLPFDATLQGSQLSALSSLREGVNQLQATCLTQDGREIKTDMIHYTERLAQKPKAIITPTLAGNQLTLDASQSQPDERDSTPIVAHSWTASPSNPAGVSTEATEQLPGRPFTGPINAEQLQLSLPAVDGEYYFTLEVVDQGGRKDTSTTYVEVREGVGRIPDYDTENPAWVESAVVYGVIPRNFGSPAFQAVTQKLDYLQELGVNALWLAPVNVSPPGDYGYAIVDYFDLNPKYGSKDDFHRLVQEAHARGMRVLMDFVPNHSSAQHPYYLDALEKGKESPYWDFYDRDENGEATHYFDWTHLPNLNYENPEVRRWMLEAFAYWVREFDVDGFRVDVAWGIRQRRPDFWMEWRRELKRTKPDLLLLAEASARDPYYFDNGYDAAYEWTDQLGHWGWELVWDSYKDRLLAYNLNDALTNPPDGFHPDALIFRFLNNNDTGDRFITRWGEGKTRVATALLLTLPGIPCIYTGDEVGEWFRPYYDPAPLTWQERYPGLKEYHQKLIALRKEIPALHARAWQRVQTAAIPQEVYAYLRLADDGSEPVLVLLNFSEEPAEVELTLPAEIQASAVSGSLTDLLAEQEIPLAAGGTLHVSLSGFGVRILMND
jgi:glycosidase